MTRKLQRLIRAKNEAVDALENEILAEMVRVAKRKKLSRFSIMSYGNRYEKAGLAVHIPELQQLDEMYCDHVNAGGFQAVWSSTRGWDAYREEQSR